jgi:hypothetical protein
MDAPMEMVVLDKRDDSADLPALIEQAGPAARFAFEEFLYGRIRNSYTRRACTFTRCEDPPAGATIGARTPGAGQTDRGSRLLLAADL